jgi:hypothetical protein
MTRLPETHCRSLAALLGHAVGTVLWPRYEARVRTREERVSLATRVGRGNATYHRADRRGGHLIVFGWKMVQQKSTGWATASRWTSGREMAARGYFDGRLDLLSVLAHAACHEFAHLVQTVEGGRKHGSVHNAAFYVVLDEMHRTGVADEVLTMLSEQCRRVGIDAQWAAEPGSVGKRGLDALFGEAGRRLATTRGLRRSKAASAKAKAKDKAAAALASAALASADRRRITGLQTDVRPGDAVSFLARGQRITGRVRRVNRRTVTIVPDQPWSPGQYWRVPPGSLERN